MEILKAARELNAVSPVRNGQVFCSAMALYENGDVRGFALWDATAHGWRMRVFGHATASDAGQEAKNLSAWEQKDAVLHFDAAGKVDGVAFWNELTQVWDVL